jgi:GTP-binding protein
MIIGENAKPQDLEANPLKSRQLTNFRASGPKDESIRLTPADADDAGAGDRLHPGR